MSDAAMTQFKTEGAPAFPVTDKGNDNPSDSSPENTDGNPSPSSGGSDENQTPKEGADAGFADHPRWKERENDWTKRFNDQEQRHVQELAKFREEMEAKLSAVGKNQPHEEAPTEIPAWFGGDESQWKDFQKWNAELVKQASTQAREEITRAEQEQKKRVDEATSYFENEVKEIESNKDLNPKGLKIDRNKLLKCALDNDLIDSQGRWNYRAAWRILQHSEPVKPSGTQEKKDLAQATTSDNRPAGKPSSVTSSKDFKNPAKRPW